ncbi:pilus assembly protein TadG-related protein [Massilia sp. TSP1-1-2]|uniref:pilus assembly protein TadG-related protein n=1 Tax=Massilia sp. TSP1-1-2 TaxID=2804649 RepID=UPI003CEC709A
MTVNRLPTNRPTLQHPGPHQRGAFAVLFAVLLILMLAFLGMALDLSRLYNRTVELQSAADAAALAAAEKLSGTAGGIDAALNVAATAAAGKKFAYENATFTWSDAALKFSTAPKGAGWMDATAARAAPEGVMFAKVDTAELGAAANTIDNYLMRFVSTKLDSSTTGASAVAGRSTTNVMPLALCAMSTVPASSRSPSNELVQYGFRRGVGYDLMQLNPGGSSPEHFVVDPIAASGASGASNTTAADVGPFVCSGTLPMSGVMKGQISVKKKFPLASLYVQLNSRFDQYSGGSCSYRMAPPDANIKSFVYTASNSWMATTPAGQTATTMTDNGKLLTVADPIPLPGSNTAAKYGLLWSYAKPVPYSAYLASPTEPAGGYVTLDKTLWPALFAPGLPDTKSGYSTAPYFSGSAATDLKPSSAHGRGLRNRRVLNIPLLLCPVSNGAKASATVLAVGKFFMTVPATSTSIYAEFAGIATDQSLGGTVELYK